MKRILLFGIVGLALYLIIPSGTGNVSWANAERERFIEQADKLSFRKGGWRRIQEADHFIIFSDRGTGHLKKKLERKLENFSLQVARRIGYKCFELYQGKNDDWNKKFKFFIYGSQRTLRQARKKLGVPDWAGAWASGNRTTSYYHLNADTKTILHELAHVIYCEYIGSMCVPIWWHEGIAMFSELSKSEIREGIMEARFRVINNTHLPLPQLTSYDVREPRLIYEQGLSVVVFLLSEYGTSSFDLLNRSMRHGKSFESSLAAAYGDDFSTINGLNSAWEDALRDRKTWRRMLKELPEIIRE